MLLLVDEILIAQNFHRQAVDGSGHLKAQHPWARSVIGRDQDARPVFASATADYGSAPHHHYI